MLTRKDIKGNYDSEIKLSAITMISYKYIFVELHANDVNTISKIRYSYIYALSETYNPWWLFPIEQSL